MLLKRTRFGYFLTALLSFYPAGIVHNFAHSNLQLANRKPFSLSLYDSCDVRLLSLI